MSNPLERELALDAWVKQEIEDRQRRFEKALDEARTMYREALDMLAEAWDRP